MSYLISIDIGGTTFSYVIFNNNVKYFVSNAFDIKKYNNVQYFISDLFLLFKQHIPNINDIIKIGIACPGPLDANVGLILNTPNITFLQNINLKNEFKKHLPIDDILIENDANVYTLGFYYNLKNKRKTDVILGITLGTGIGVGMIINGSLFKGSYGMAGEYEYSPLLNNMTWADLIGHRFFKTKTLELFKTTLTPKELYDLAEINNKHANEIWKEYGTNIGLCLSHIISILNPNYISIGGGISKANTYFHKFMIETLQNNCLIFKEDLINISYDTEVSNIYDGWSHPNVII
jgi:glucokinase